MRQRDLEVQRTARKGYRELYAQRRQDRKLAEVRNAEDRAITNNTNALIKYFVSRVLPYFATVLARSPAPEKSQEVCLTNLWEYPILRQSSTMQPRRNHRRPKVPTWKTKKKPPVSEQPSECQLCQKCHEAGSGWSRSRKRQERRASWRNQYATFIPFSERTMNERAMKL
jgi:hypothetical protein